MASYVDEKERCSLIHLRVYGGSSEDRKIFLAEDEEQASLNVIGLKCVSLTGPMILYDSYTVHCGRCSADCSAQCMGQSAADCLREARGGDGFAQYDSCCTSAVGQPKT